MNILVPFSGKYPDLYNNMRVAIAQCCSVDECKDIKDKSAALAAYCDQIGDRESVRKFNEIRIRAFRRLGELFKDVDTSACKNQRDAHKTICDHFQSPAVSQLSKYEVNACLEFAKRSEEFFEKSIAESRGTLKSVVDYGRASICIVYQAFSTEDLAEIAEEQAKVEFEEEIEERISASHNEAVAEIGITLSRKDRKAMHETTLLLERDVHKVLRLAAFEREISQQEVIRQALQMWFDASGYSVVIPSTAKKKAS